MLTSNEYNKLLHDIKRAAQVLKFVQDESDHSKRQLFISLMIDEMNRLAGDIEELKE